jgi:WD40 repeat protein
VYLNEAYKLGRDTPALRFMLGQAMQAIDPLEDIQINTGGSVRRPAFSADSKRFITPTETADGVVAQIWGTASGKQLAFLKDLPQSPLVTQFLPDGKRVLVSGYTKEIPEESRGEGAFTGIWDTTTGTQLTRYAGHTGRFGQPNDAMARLLVTADAADALGARVWDLATGKSLHTLNTGARILAASLSPDSRQVLTGDERGDVRLWDAGSGRLVFRLPGRMPSHVIGTLFTADGRRALAFGARGDVRIWDLVSGELLLAYAADSGGFNDVVLAADGKQLISVGVDGYKVWDIQRGILKFSHGDNLTNWSSAALSADGSLLATSTENQPFVELLHLPSRSSLLTLESSGQINAAIFSPDGQRLLLASGNGQIGLWRLPIRPQRQFRHERRNDKFSSLYAARFAPSEQRVLTASYDGSLRLWDTNSGALLKRLDGSSPVIDANFSPDQQRLASLAEDGSLKLRNAGTTALVASVKLAPVWAADPLVFSPDSRLLAVLPDFYQQEIKTLDIFSALDGAKLMTLPLACVASALVFIRDGAELVTGCADGKLQIWNTQSGARVQALEGPRTQIWRLALSKDGSRLAAAAMNDPEIRLWDLTSAKALRSFSLPSQQFPEALAFNNDGRLLAIGSNTGKVLVRNLERGELHALGAHTKRVQGLQFLPNDLLLSYRADSVAKLWDPWRAELLGDVALHDWSAWSAEINNAGTQLLTGGIDGVAAIWDLSPEKRRPAEIAEQLRCRSPWQLSAETLAPASATPGDCAKAQPPNGAR